jgi:hypothetical protein
MAAEAKVLKNLKGPLRSGRRFGFSETAWVGPTYQTAELRILFLEKVPSRDVSMPAEWRILGRLDAKTDFLIRKDSLSQLSLKSLNTFLNVIGKSKDRPKKVIFSKSETK